MTQPKWRIATRSYFLKGDLTKVRIWYGPEEKVITLYGVVGLHIIELLRNLEKRQFILHEYDTKENRVTKPPVNQIVVALIKNKGWCAAVWDGLFWSLLDHTEESGTDIIANDAILDWVTVTDFIKMHPGG